MTLDSDKSDKKKSKKIYSVPEQVISFNLHCKRKNDTSGPYSKHLKTNIREDGVVCSNCDRLVNITLRSFSEFRWGKIVNILVFVFYLALFAASWFSINNDPFWEYVFLFWLTMIILFDYNLPLWPYIVANFVALSFYFNFFDPLILYLALLIPFLSYTLVFYLRLSAVLIEDDRDHRVSVTENVLDEKKNTKLDDFV